MWVIRHRAIFYSLSLVLCAASVYAFFALPIRYSVEFTGGTAIEVSYEGERPAPEAVAASLEAAGAQGVLVRPSGDNLSVRLEPVGPEARAAVMAALAVPGAGTSTVVSESTIGPSLGHELAGRMGWAFLLVALAIAGFVGIAFRRVSSPVPSWKYGAVTILALVHDIVITAGAFVAFGLVLNAPIDALFVTALLVILGYSVNDTIVVFDRIRENLGRSSEREREQRFDEIAGRSVRETAWRSIGTSATTAIALVILAIFGGEVTRAFALALVLGVISGTYSSIFLAAPMLVTWQRFAARRAK